jgi:hypothetical protein
VLLSTMKKVEKMRLDSNFDNIPRFFYANKISLDAAVTALRVEADEKHQGMSPVQEAVLTQWIRWSMKKYNFSADKVITHRTVVETDCPCWIFPTEEDFAAWKKEKLA